MARTVNPTMYRTKATAVEAEMPLAQVSYKFVKDAEPFHSLRVDLPFVSGKETKVQRNAAAKKVRSQFPFRFDFEGSQITENKKGEKVHRMTWVCYL